MSDDTQRKPGKWKKMTEGESEKQSCAVGHLTRLTIIPTSAVIGTGDWHGKNKFNNDIC